VAQIANIQVPYLFKWVVDALDVPGGEVVVVPVGLILMCTTTHDDVIVIDALSFPAQSRCLVRVTLTTSVDSLRTDGAVKTAANLFNEARNAVFAKVPSSITSNDITRTLTPVT